MKFALFYEFPVARPWEPGAEHRAYKNTLEQAVFAEGCGWDAFWTVAGKRCVPSNCHVRQAGVVDPDDAVGHGSRLQLGAVGRRLSRCVPACRGGGPARLIGS